MAHTIDAYCRNCKKSTAFGFDGRGWECRTCGTYNKHGDHSDLESYYNIFRDY